MNGASGQGPVKILIINPFGIGDVIFSFWMVEAIRSAEPEAVIDYLCNERTHDLVQLNRSVRRYHSFDRDQFRKTMSRNPLIFLRDVLRWFRQLRRERYDLCFDLSVGRDYAFVMMLLGVRRRIGFDYKGRGRFLTDRIVIDGYEGRPIRDYYSSLVRLWRGESEVRPAYPMLHRDAQVSREARGWCENRGIGPGERLLILSAAGGRSWGANAHFKQWSPERFAAVARHVSSKYGLPVVLMGDQEEEGLLQWIRERSRIARAHVIAGGSLAHVVELMRRGVLFIGNDGGLSHLADLVSLPQVVLFGPVDERVYGPLDSDRSTVITEPVPCRPCYRRFQFPPCRYEKRCLENISVDRVLEACDALLRSKACQGYALGMGRP